MKFNKVIGLMSIIFLLTSCNVGDRSVVNTLNKSVLLGPDYVQASNIETPIYISTYTTYFEDSTENRKTNISLASSKLNGAVVNPGETFSFNETVGPNNEEDGYKLSKIFIDGEETEGFGGGVCQVSSTLYNAVYVTNLDVIERNPHSKEVFYVKPDRDAATSYGGIDFKFLNNFDYPIKILAKADENSLKIDLIKG